MSFIMVWKVARLLVMPKNITRGLKRPWLVQKTAFHLSPDTNIVETPANIQFGEVLGFLELEHKLGD